MDLLGQEQMKGHEELADTCALDSLCSPRASHISRSRLCRVCSKSRLVGRNGCSLNVFFIPFQLTAAAAQRASHVCIFSINGASARKLGKGSSASAWNGDITGRSVVEENEHVGRDSEKAHIHCSCFEFEPTGLNHAIVARFT